MMEPFNVRRKSTAVFGVDLDLIRLESRFWSFIHRNCQTSIYFFLSISYVLLSTSRAWKYSHPTPKESHAASTSGPASCRNILVFSSEPLKVTVWSEVSTSFKIGASKRLAMQFQASLLLFRIHTYNIVGHAEGRYRLDSRTRISQAKLQTQPGRKMQLGFRKVARELFACSKFCVLFWIPQATFHSPLHLGSSRDHFHLWVVYTWFGWWLLFLLQDR